MAEFTPTADLRHIQQLIKDAQEMLTHAQKALEPLVKIADAYDANNLDDEARKYWGAHQEHENATFPEKIVLYTGRGGGTLLTLADCFAARNLVRGVVVLVPPVSIKLKEKFGPWSRDQELEVEEVIPHGGHSDSEKQYRVGQYYIPSDIATEL